MASRDSRHKGPYWTKNWIESMWRYTNEHFVDYETGSVDYLALGREEFEFRKALFFRRFQASPRAEEAFAEASRSYGASVANGKAGGRPRKTAQDARDGDAREDKNSPTSCANLCGDACVSDAHDGISGLESTAGAARTTVSAKACGTRASGRYAPPSGIHKDGKFKDKVNDKEARTETSTNDLPDGHSGPSHGGSVANNCTTAGSGKRRSGGDSLRVGGEIGKPPARSPGGMPDDKQQVYDYACSEGLDPADAYECWHVTVIERGGQTSDGKPVKNWKAYVRKWCETRKARRQA